MPVLIRRTPRPEVEGAKEREDIVSCCHKRLSEGSGVVRGEKLRWGYDAEWIGRDKPLGGRGVGNLDDRSGRCGRQVGRAGEIPVLEEFGPCRYTHFF